MVSVADLQNAITKYEQREQQFGLDIQDLNDLVNALKVAEEKSAILSAIVDSSDDAIISKDLNGIVMSWNNAAERIFGYSPEEIIGHSILKLIPADRVDEEPKILARLRSGERVEHFETKRVGKSGTLIDVSLTISPVKDKSGQIIGLSKIARNITDLRQAEEKNAMMTAIVDSTDDVVISKDLNGIVTSWNTSAQRIFGYTADEMIGQSILTLIPEDRKDEEPIILEKLRGGQRVDHFETKRVTKAGRLIDVSLTISPVRNKNGVIIGLSKIARDITDKKLEEQRKNDFIALVSHELKTPLTSMKSYIQLLLIKARKETDTFGLNALTRTEIQVNKMTNMIHDFLNIARLEQGKMGIDRIEFELAPLIGEVLDDGRILSANHSFSSVGCDQIILKADRDKIGLVLTNLISNAIKYSPSGGEITVECIRGDSKVEVMVKDQGVGISPEDQKRLFERFYRVRDEQIKNVSGFGIGLYLVSEILRMHDTQIHVSSEPGKGSVFSFVLETA
ncbi:MAG TPA: PAS domain S-box protein [Pedobacter sp.]|nr:PAS domain S-box protein [Pedobacter sp.]